MTTQPAHADVPDCTEANKRDSSGIHRDGDQAVVSFTLSADCVVSLHSYAKPGPGHTAVEVDVARGIGRHTLTVRACAQVDFVPGPTHEQGSGEKFSAERYDAKCEEVPPSTTTIQSETRVEAPPSTRDGTSTTAPATTTSVAPSTTTTTPLVSAANPRTTTTAAVLGAVITQPAPSAELPRTGSSLHELTGVALTGMGLGLGALTAGSVRRKRSLRSAVQVPR